MAEALLVFASHDGRLNGYNRGDIVDIVSANRSPGATVVANSPTRFGFVFITDIEPDDVAQLRSLLDESQDENAPADGDGKRELLAKRGWKVPVAPLGATSLTYRTFSDPLAVKYTFTQLRNAVIRKTRAEAVAQRVAVLTARRNAIDARIAQLTG